MDWIYSHPKLVIAGTSLLSIPIGYWLRWRQEKRDNLREALYLLLEIWHQITVLSIKSIDKDIDVFFERLRTRFPQEDISDVDEKAFKSHLSSVLLHILKGRALEEFDGMQDAFSKVVNLISRTNPVYAYQLDSVSSIKQRLSAIDEYFQSTLPMYDSSDENTRAFAERVRHKIVSRAETDEGLELEKKIGSLAIRVGIFTWLRAVKVINRRKKTLESSIYDDMDEIDALLDELLAI